MASLAAASTPSPPDASSPAGKALSKLESVDGASAPALANEIVAAILAGGIPTLFQVTIPTLFFFFMI